MMDGIKIMGDMETITIEDITKIEDAMIIEMIMKIIESMIETQEMKIEEDTKDTVDLIKHMKDQKEDNILIVMKIRTMKQDKIKEIDMKTIEKKEIMEITITFEETTEKEDEKKQELNEELIMEIIIEEDEHNLSMEPTINMDLMDKEVEIDDYELQTGIEMQQEESTRKGQSKDAIESAEVRKSEGRAGYDRWSLELRGSLQPCTNEEQKLNPKNDL
ncbi:hypothetical protein FQR65_LT18737 [Abscondita terminalis]|nr:hypothetical protein FQR65_LT18737 [Abscondita terminalis]